MIRCAICRTQPATVIWPVRGEGEEIHVCDECDAEVERKNMDCDHRAMSYVNHLTMPWMRKCPLCRGWIDSRLRLL